MTINSVVRKFLGNCHGFWDKYYLLIIIFIIALACDALSTIYFMSRIGVDYELHPVIRFISELFGPILGPLMGAVGKAAAGITVSIYCRRFAFYILLAASIISFWAGWYNIWGVNLYAPNILKWIPW